MEERMCTIMLFSLDLPGPVSVDHPGPRPDRKDGSCFAWKAVGDK